MNRQTPRSFTAFLAGLLFISLPSLSWAQGFGPVVPPPTPPPSVEGTLPSDIASELSSLKAGEARTLLIIRFASGQNALSVAQMDGLVAPALSLAQVGAGDFAIEVRGYTDDLGDPEFNLDLSNQRASRVLNLFVASIVGASGDPPSEVKAVGYGERHSVPRVGPAVAERALERRVEIIAKRVTVTTPPTEPADDGTTAEAEPPLEPLQLSELPFAPAPAETIVFDDESADVVIELVDNRLDQSPAGTIEFWTAPGWDAVDELEHDPVVLGLSDGERIKMTVAIARDRNAILLWNGTVDAPVGVAAPLDRGRLHHVAVVLESGRATVYLDGLALPGPFPFLLGNAGANRLEVGSALDGTLAFLGRVARIRFWDQALDAADVETLMGEANPPARDDPRRDAFLGAVTRSGDGTITMREEELKIPLASSHYAPFGATALALSNRLEIAATPGAPDLRPLLDPARGARSDDLETLVENLESALSFGCPPSQVCGTQEERMAAAQRTIEAHEQETADAQTAVNSATYPVVKLTPVDAVHPADLTFAPIAPTDEIVPVTVGRDRDVAEIRIWVGDGTSVRGIEVVPRARFNGDDVTPVSLGLAPPFSESGTAMEGLHRIELKEDERVVNFTATLNGDTLSNLVIETDHPSHAAANDGAGEPGVHGPFGRDMPGRTVTYRLPRAIKFTGFTARGGQLANLRFPEFPPEPEGGSISGELGEIRVLQGEYVLGLEFRSREIPRTSVQVGRWRDDVGEQDGIVLQNVITLEPDERLLSISARQDRDRINQLTFHTTHRLYGPYGRRTGDDPVQIRLPQGVPVVGLEAEGGNLATLKVRLGSDDLGPGLLAEYEDGRATRFAREDRNRFVAVSTDVPIPGFRASVGTEFSPDGIETGWTETETRPALTVLAPDRIELDGLERTLRAVDPHPQPQRNTRFDDTFVSLSKAVNLQANYNGYDIVRMDPIHLTDTGASERIFQMPSGASGGYHDVNRIFVPNGLIYTPLFTGQANNHTTTTATLEDYKNTFSRTVGADVSGRLAPAKFAYSNTVEHVRGGFTRNETVRTTGLSQVYFYALSVDKARMPLARGFRDAVAALAEDGDYNAFVDAFGTHYAANVFYGGLGVLDMTSSTTEIGLSESDMNSMSLKAGGLLDAATETAIGLSYSETSKRESDARSTFGSQVDHFYWVGGTHMGADRQNWSVSPDGAVPVHVDLRPIDELLTPFFFEDDDITRRVRQELAMAVEKRLENIAAIEASLSPLPHHQFDVEITSLVCQHHADHWDGQYLYTNNVALQIVPFDGSRTVVPGEGPLVEGVKPTQEALDMDPRGFRLTLDRGYEMNDICTEPSHHGDDFLAKIVPEQEKANRKGSFSLRADALQRGGATFRINIVSWSGFIGTPDLHSVSGQEAVEVRNVICDREQARSPNFCVPRLGGPLPRSVSDEIRVQQAGGPGVLAVGYTLSYRGLE